MRNEVDHVELKKTTIQSLTRKCNLFLFEENLNMGKNRHDFSQGVIKTLERRVNGKCSNPECRVSTSGPTNDSSGSSSMGIAAHIAAASPGGPRYDPGMSPAQRKSIDNGIWLCSNCSIMIDRDVARYRVELLQNWKRSGEQLADQQYGQPPLSKSNYDALHSLAFRDLKKNKIANAVSSICQLAAEEMQRLDPRFEIDVAHLHNQTSYIFNAKEPVHITCKVTDDFKTEFSEKFAALISHGEDLKIDAKAVRFEGSPLFDIGRDQEATISIINNARKPAVMRLGIFEKTGSTSFKFGEIHGEIVAGSKSATFKGQMFGGIFSLEFTCMIDNDGGSKTKSAIDLQCWEGRSLLSLPYFERINEFYSALYGNERIALVLEMDGIEILHGSGRLTELQDEGSVFVGLFRYIRNARHILGALNLDACFEVGTVITVADMEFAEMVYQQMNANKGKVGGEIGISKIKMALLPNVKEDQINSFISGKGSIFRIDQELEPPGKIFGHDIKSIVMRNTYSNAAVKNLQSKTKLEFTKEYELELHPEDDCQIFTELMVGSLDIPPENL